MAKVEAKFEVLPSMAGEVKYYQRPCPYGQKAMGSGGVAMVGSISCQMCPNYVLSEGVRDTDDNLVEIVECNRDND